jgi:hypothetical protein
MPILFLFVFILILMLLELVRLWAEIQVHLRP